MRYWEKIAELADYFNTIDRFYDISYDRGKAGISYDNQRLRAFLQYIDKITAEMYRALPVHPVVFQPKEPVVVLFIDSLFESFYQRHELTPVYGFDYYVFNPDNLYSYEFYPETANTGRLEFWRAKGNNLRYERIAGLEVIQEYRRIADILDFAINYPAFKKILKPEHFRSYEKLFRALFGDIKWDIEKY